jgi:SAM-dependent methyltransferase
MPDPRAIANRLRRRARLEARRTLERTAGARAAEAGPPPAVYLHGAEGSRPRSLWPSFPPPSYLGQLDPAFQVRLAEERAFIDQDDCHWYHLSVLRNGEVIPGAWDLRGGEDTYLGGVALAGKRILELGPASGYLTFHMEREGAEVVGLDAGWDVSIDLLPRPGVDTTSLRMGYMQFIGAVQNSWWYVHRDLGSTAKVVYGDIYRLPADLGMFDVSLFGAILLHLRDPFSAIAQAALRTTERIVVTDLVQDPALDQNDNVLRFAPMGMEHLTNWWSITPGAVCRMLSHVGFGQTTVTYHTQKHHLGHDLAAAPVDMSMFTVIGERP